MEPVQPFNWEIISAENDFDYDEIRVWCFNRQSEVVVVRIIDMPAEAYLEFDADIMESILDSPDKTKNPTLNSIKYFISQNDDFVLHKKLLGLKILENKTFLYNHRQAPCIYMRCVNRKVFEYLEKARRKGGLKISKDTRIPFEMWEWEIPSYDKLMARKKLNYCGWFNSKKAEVVPQQYKISKYKEYFISSNNINVLTKEETQGWVSNPSFLCLDIEQYSKNHDKFPSKELQSDEVFIVSLQYGRINGSGCRRICIALLKHGDIITSREGEDYEIDCVDTEQKLLDRIMYWIDTLDPDLLLGYNIQGYDIPCLDHRLIREFRSWSNISRVKDEISTVKDFSSKTKAYGYQPVFTFVGMSGRIVMDLLYVVQKKKKLASYSLKEVAKAYKLGENKVDVSYKRLFKGYKDYLESTKDNREECLTEMRELIRYCMQDSNLVWLLFNKLKLWYECVETCNIVYCNISNLWTKGVQARSKICVYTNATQEGIVLDHRHYSQKYKGAIVMPPVTGKHKNMISLDFSSLYPSLIMQYNLCYTTLCDPEQEAISDDKCWCYDFEEQFSESIDKNDPRVTEYLKDYDPNKEDGDDEEVLDEIQDDEEEDEIFKTKEEEKEKDEDDEDEEDRDITKRDVWIRRENKRTKKVLLPYKVHHKFKFVKSEVRRGILPRIVERLVNERKEVRKMIEVLEASENPDKVLIDILNARQLALKISANSFYGILGCKENSVLPLIQAAVAITYSGRVSITKAKNFIENEGHTVVYGDTDSCKVVLNGVPDDQVESYGRELGKRVSALFGNYMKMAYENCGLILCLKKKKYAYCEWITDKKDYYRDANNDLVIKSIGLITARRDNFSFQRKMYYHQLQMIMGDESVFWVADYILTCLEKLANMQIPIEELSINKSFGISYKSDTAAMKVFSDELRKLGIQVQPGERVDMVVVDTGNKKHKQGMKLRLLNRYDSAKDFPLDVIYYLGLIYKNTDQLFRIGFKNLWKREEPPVFEDLKAKHISKIFFNMYKRKFSIQDIRCRYMSHLLSYYS